jgi:hypothetical protein
MTKISSYEKSLTLFGRIFSKLSDDRGRYFLGAIKHDFVFFLFALIWRGDNSSEKKGFSAGDKQIGKRFFPKNFNEWKFGSRFIVFEETNRDLWDLDIKYFRNNEQEKKQGGQSAVLTYGLDFGRAFTLDSLGREEKIGVVVDWQGDLPGGSFRTVKKWRVFLSASFYGFILQNLNYLAKIYGILTKNCRTNVSRFDFFRYFVYYTFQSARIRCLMMILSGYPDIGKVIFSDIDNAWGNSFMVWSRFYGFSQIAYPHGASLYLDQHRYFEPDVYRVYTVCHKEAIEKSGSPSRIVVSSPAWLKGDYLSDKSAGNRPVKKIAFVTGMEKNLEVPFGDKETIMNYLGALSGFSREKGVSLLIKSHKLLDWHQDYDDFSKKFDGVSHIKDRWNYNDIRQIDIGILASTESTLALQLLCLGKPVITCSEAVSPIYKKHFSAPDLQFVANYRQDLLCFLERLLTDNDFYLRSQEEARLLFARLTKLPEKD